MLSCMAAEGSLARLCQKMQSPPQGCWEDLAERGWMVVTPQIYRPKDEQLSLSARFFPTEEQGRQRGRSRWRYIDCVFNC